MGLLHTPGGKDEPNIVFMRNLNTELRLSVGVSYLVEQPPHCDLLRLSLLTSRNSQNDLDNTCEENDEQFEVSDIQNTYDHKNQNDQDLDDVECPETQTLLLKPRDKNSNPKRDICDKESGFSSDSQLLNC